MTSTFAHLAPVDRGTRDIRFVSSGVELAGLELPPSSFVSLARPSCGLQSDTQPARFKRMNFRKLYGALTLLLFVVPIGAAVCGNCIAGDCRLTSSASGTSEPSEAQAQGHCQKAEEPSEETAPCHSPSPAMASSDCCSMTAAPEPERATAPVVSVSFVIALSVALYAELPATDQSHADDRQRLPSSQPPQPLYTLHSAFLI